MGKATKSSQTCRRCGNSSQVIQYQWEDDCWASAVFHGNHICLECGLYVDGNGSSLGKESLQKYRKDYGHIVLRCVVGCQVFYGGEKRHHKDCPYYPDSITKMFDDTKERLEELQAVSVLPWEFGAINDSATTAPQHKGSNENARKENVVFRKLLDVAIMEAEDGLSEGGIPIGSALGDSEGNILAVGHNMRVQDGKPMAHAEISCLDSGRRDFRGLILASTLMPCALCAGAAIQFGIDTVVVGENRTFEGEGTLLKSRGVKVVNLDDEKCVRMMSEFVLENPNLWDEDIGAH